MRRLCAIAALCVIWSAPVMAEENPGSAAAAAQAISTAIQQSQTKTSMVLEATTKSVVDTLDEMAQQIKKTLITAQAMKEEARRESPPYIGWVWMISRQNQNGLVVTDRVRAALNDITLQTTLGYKNVVSQTFGPNDTQEYNEGIYADGALTAAARIYDTHVRLFCLPGSKNAPEGCGSAREAAGVRGGETFIDFMVGEKTWQSAYVLESMKLARAYFGLITDTAHLEEMRSSRETFIRRQATLARNNLRLAMVNYLAARRAPTSNAAAMAQLMFMGNATDTDQLSDFNINSLCDKPDTEMSDFEYMTCMYTSKPSTDGGERIISQAALDRILQHDFYMSPRFYQTVRDPQYAADGPMDQMSVLLKAQQLAQDYQNLRMLQMKVAATAVATVSGGF